MAVGVRYGLMGGLAGFATTALGALPALALRSIPQKLEDSLLGFAAGVFMFIGFTAFAWSLRHGSISINGPIFRLNVSGRF